MCATTLSMSGDSSSAVHPARFHALDAVRASALLLGVVFHAAESFESNAVTYWAVGDRSSSTVLEVFRHASHSFRMELFFLIAGFFAHLLWQRRGVAGFVTNRAGRILAPLVVGWVVLFPLLVFLWLTGAVRMGNWGPMGLPEELRAVPPWQLTLGLFFSGQFVQKFDLTHLWFLHQLLVLYALALVVRGAVLLCPWREWIVSGLDHGAGRLILSPLRAVWFAVLVWPPLLLQEGWSVGTPKSSLIPDPAITWLYAICFGLGWALHRQVELLDACRRHWRAHLGLGVVLTVVTSLGIRLVLRVGWLSHPEPWLRPVYLLVYGLMMGAFVFGFLGLFLDLCHAESPAWRYLADSSYWVYLVHLPVVVALQIVVAPWSQPWWVKFPLVLLCAVPLLYLSYHVLVRSTLLGVWLNGRRFPFVSPWRLFRSAPGSGSLPP